MSDGIMPGAIVFGPYQIIEYESGEYVMTVVGTRTGHFVGASLWRNNEQVEDTYDPATVAMWAELYGATGVLS